MEVRPCLFPALPSNASRLTQSKTQGCTMACQVPQGLVPDHFANLSLAFLLTHQSASPSGPLAGLNMPLCCLQGLACRTRFLWTLMWLPLSLLPGLCSDQPHLSLLTLCPSTHLNSFAQHLTLLPAKPCFHHHCLEKQQNIVGPQ